MKTRMIAGMVAVVLAIAGTVVLVGYVRGADSRAMAGLETVNVLVAAAPIPEGAASADVAKLSAVKQLPATAALPDRVTSVDQLAGQVALVALEPGEQLLASKFGPPPSTAPDALIIPPELQQVTVLLELQRALGGQIKAGDTVGVFLSATDTKQTHLTAHKVLVTKVERATPKDATAVRRRVPLPEMSPYRTHRPHGGPSRHPGHQRPDRREDRLCGQFRHRLAVQRTADRGRERHRRSSTGSRCSNEQGPGATTSDGFARRVRLAVGGDSVELI